MFATGLTIPEGLVFDDAARLIVAEWGVAPSRVSRLPPGGGAVAAATLVGTGFVHLYGVVRAPSDDGFFVADVGGNRVAHVHRDGRLEDVLVDVASPAGLWLAKNGDLLVAELAGDAFDSRGYLIRVTAPSPNSG